MKAHVFVTLKQEVLDPQGKAVCQALHSLGFAAVQDARVGKFIELEVKESDAEKVETELRLMCEKLLANPVIEDFRYELIE